jgi:hypothetical protein
MKEQLRRLRRTGLRSALVGLTATATVMVMSPGVAHAELSLLASDSFGYAAAGIDFTGPSTFNVHDLVVVDAACNAEAPYARFYYRLGSSIHRWDRTPAKRYDHSGCDAGDFSTYTNLPFELSGDTIAEVFLVICDSSGCEPGNTVHNPHVGG